MNFFGIHFCSDELVMILMCVPFLGSFVARLRLTVKAWRQHRWDQRAFPPRSRA